MLARPYHLLQGPKPDLVIGKRLRLKGVVWEREGTKYPGASISLLFLNRI